MVNDFLNMAQFQLGKGVVTLKPGVKVPPILQELVEELSFKAESRGIYLKLEKSKQDFVINADAEKLKAALFNIIDNSVKYTVKGGATIKIYNSDDKKFVIIETKDTGIGIDPEKAKTLFEQQFERSEAAKKVSAVGSGIGLYLSGQIIKLHNGKVWAKSEGEGKGSTFYVELPIGGADKKEAEIKK